MRTNIFIDEDIIKTAMDVSGLKTKKDTVDRALREFIVLHSRKDLLELKGKIQFAEGYDHRGLREGR